MRTTVPPAFDVFFCGPEGEYTIRFQPTDEWDGLIDVSIGGLGMRWDVDHADREDGGGLVLGGMTSGSEPLWNDQYWFELRLDDTPPVIRYWGDKVIWREDRATSSPTFQRPNMTAAMQSDVEAIVLEKARELTAFPDRMNGSSTEIYYDTRISGDGLWDLITGVRARFGTDFSRMDASQFAPAEGAELFRPLLMLLGRRPYRSLTVADLAEAVKRGQWRD